MFEDYNDIGIILIVAGSIFVYHVYKIMGKFILTSVIKNREIEKVNKLTHKGGEL